MFLCYFFHSHGHYPLFLFEFILLVKVNIDSKLCKSMKLKSEKRRLIHHPNRNKIGWITHQTSGSNRSNNDEIAVISKIRKFGSCVW